MRRPAGRRAPLWVAPLALLAMAVGCTNTGLTYPFDVLPEMHYQSSFRMQEPPRKQPPKDSVPVQGREVIDLAALPTTRGPERSVVNAEKAKALYMKNCAACHGEKADGKGKVAEFFIRDKAPAPPADLTSATTKSKTDGELFVIITNGRGQMPAWKNLLTEDERWILAEYVKDAK